MAFAVDGCWGNQAMIIARLCAIATAIATISIESIAVAQTREPGEDHPMVTR